MQTALDIASITFAVTVLFGLGMLAFWAWSYFGHDRFAIKQPILERLPTIALDQARDALERMKAHYYRTSGASRTPLGHDIHRLEMRIQFLQKKTDEEQFLYYQLGRRRDQAWHQWKEAFGQMTAKERHARQNLHTLIRDAVGKYRELDRALETERHQAVARDHLNLEELQAQGVLASQAVDISREPPPLDPVEERRSTGEAEDGASPIPAAADEPTDATEELYPPTSPAESNSSSESSPPTEPLEEPLGEPVVATESGEPAQPIPSGEAEPSAEGEAAPQTEKVESTSPVESATEEETPLPPFEIETYGEFGQTEFDASDSPKTGLRYADPTFELTALPEGELVGSDLTGTSFARVKFQALHRYRDCIMAGIDLRRIELLRRETPHKFLRCDLKGASFAEAAIEYTLFAHCDLSGSLWNGARLDRVKFVNCRIDRVQWGQVDLSRTVMSADMMAGIDFSEAAHPPHNYPGAREPAPTQTDQPEPDATEASRTIDKADSGSSQEPSASPDSSVPDASNSDG